MPHLWFNATIAFVPKGGWNDTPHSNAARASLTWPEPLPGIFFSAGWRSVREAGPQRLALTALLLVLAVLLARYSWNLPFTGNAEQRLYDARAYALAEEVETDERVTLVVYTDQTLFDYGKRSPLPRNVLAAALRTIDSMGPKAIGIDILFDQPQDEDGE